MVSHAVELSDADERRAFGESLPPGLKLIHWFPDNPFRAVDYDPLKLMKVTARPMIAVRPETTLPITAPNAIIW